jgi:hypothetical protein
MADGNQAVAFGECADVFNGQGHESVNGEADGGMAALTLSDLKAVAGFEGDIAL